WFRPRRPEKPGSELVATLIAVGVTPWSGDMVFVPGPQTFFRVPKSPGPAAEPAVVVVSPPVVGVAPPPPLRPQALAMSTTASSVASEPNRFTMLPPQSPALAGAASNF